MRGNQREAVGFAIVYRAFRRLGDYTAAGVCISLLFITEE
jgi:hypothetical protein